MVSRRIQRLFRRYLKIDDPAGFMAVLQGQAHDASADSDASRLLSHFPEFVEGIEGLCSQLDDQVKMAIRNLQISSAELTQANRTLESMIRANQAILDSLGQALLSFDHRGICDSVFSAACLRLLEGDPTGRPIAEVLKLDARQREQMGTALDILFVSNTSAVPIDDIIALLPQTYTHAEGLHISLEYRPMFDAAGRLSNILLVATDRTQEVEAEKKVRMHEELLHHAQKMEAIGQLTSGIAHDFNTTLSIILSGTSLMRKKIDAGDARGRYLMNKIADIETASRQGAELVRNLMIFSRQRKLKQEVTDVNNCVLKTSHLLRGSLGALVRCDVYLENGIWPITVDSSQLEHALINLAVNARDAMPQGGTVKFETRNIPASTENPGGAVMIAVSDTGTGISKAIRDRIFDPFFTTKPPGEGTGLGLSLVYSFVKQSRGYVEVFSEEGGGAEFRLYFPAKDAHAERELENAI